MRRMHSRFLSFKMFRRYQTFHKNEEGLTVLENVIILALCAAAAVGVWAIWKKIKARAGENVDDVLKQSQEK